MKRLALMAVHPFHINNMFSGAKIFEYRKCLPKQEITHLALYSTSPVKKIVAVAEVVNRITGNPESIWKKTSFGAGISRKFFDDYFIGKSDASALVLGNVYRLTSPVPLNQLSGNKLPPQSFYYLDDHDVDIISSKQESVPTTPPSLLFIGGVHGLYKTTLCENTFDPLGYSYYTASSLIAKQQNNTNHLKKVDNIAGNQSALLRELSLVKGQNSRILLDGHYTLINSRGDVEPIDKEVFKAIKPSALILVQGSSGIISRQIMNRDGVVWTEEFINHFQSHEEKNARFIADQMKIPLHIIDNKLTATRFSSVMKKLFRNDDQATLRRASA